MSLMSASYPGYSNYPTIGWRGNMSNHIPARTVNNALPSHDHQAISVATSPPTTAHHSSRNANTTYGSPTNRTAAIPFSKSNSSGFPPHASTAGAPRGETQQRYLSNAALHNENLPSERKLNDMALARSKSDGFIGSPQNTAAGSSPWLKKSPAAASSAGIATVGSPKRSTADIEKEINGQSLYKTELCRSFVETGMCRYGSKCQFAHGRSELRPVLRHPKYKTEICKTFHTIGTCPYGTRCRFIHKKTEVEIGDNSIFFPTPPNSSNPDWAIWNDEKMDGNFDDLTTTIPLDGVPHNLPTPPKERRKTSESLPQMQQKIDKHKALRNQTRQRSNTDSPPPRRKNGSHITGVPRVSSPIANGHTKKEIDNDKRNLIWGSPDMSQSDLFAYENSDISSDPSDLCALSSHSSYSLPMLMMPLPPAPYSAHPVHGSSPPDSCIDPLDEVIDGSVLTSPDIRRRKTSDSSLMLQKREGTRQRSNSSSSRLPIFQVLCTDAVSEEELAVGMSACNLNHELSSSSS